MDQNFCIRLCIFCASQSVMAFNIEPVSWKTFTAPPQSQNVSFGYKVIQRASSLIVSDPLIQINQERRGLIYNCIVAQGTCSSLTINVPPEAVNMSLGLSMVQDPRSSKLAICGPTIPKKCASVTTFNGMCLISENSAFKPPIPSSLRDCPAQFDIAFLLDGSGSVNAYNFGTMKNFVINMIKRFTNRDGQFAIAQYSSRCTIHYNFNQLKDSTWESKVTNIPYFEGPTYTAAAIIKLVNELFTPNAGLRPSAKKILLVITDGVSHDRPILKDAASQAEAKNIIRYAIGVGGAFDNYWARDELNTIASDPDVDYVFKVTDFNALNNILQKLEENIIAIEGTQTSGDSSRMEFAQDGFSAAFTPYGSVLLSAVGAFQWKGGYQEYLPDYPFLTGSEHESYLGYSTAIAITPSSSFAILGAPRYRHKGQVFVSQLKSSQYKQLLDSPKPQIGSYFGAEVCAVNLNSDSYTDLLLVSAPTYTESDREGLVAVYIFERQENLRFSYTLVGMAGQRGRFGSSLASPADLNGDGFMDVLVGAPLEEDGQGSIYIFNGINEGVIPKYSQRIVGSSVGPGLRFFGISLSQSSLDQTQDSLPDIAVGSKGAVLLLRSRPIMLLETKVTYNPTKIPTGDQTDCTKPLTNNLTVCFIMSGYKHTIQDLAANINYTITLDSKRHKYRAYFSAKNRLLSDVTKIKLQEVCKNHTFFIEACSEDSLNPLVNQITFTFEGLPSGSMENLSSVLLPEIKTSTDHNLDFEINCGTDNVCVDDLRMDFNFSGSTNIEVGIMQELNVIVFVENRGENSYNTLFTLKYPFGLSYRRFTSKQGRVECVSLDAERGVTLGETSCQISKPILKGNTQVVFDITYSINKESTLGQNVSFAAAVASGNDKHSSESEFNKQKTIGVKYAIYIALIRDENSTIHINFTSGKRDLMKPIQQILKVQNELRELTFKVFIRVPVKLGDADIWTDSNLQIPGCTSESMTKPVITNITFLDAVKNYRVVNCSVAVCAVFSCDVTLLKNEKNLYNIFGNVSSGWIEQTGLKAAVFELVSSASLDYDKSKYIFFSSDSQHTAPSAQINTQVEVFEEANLTKEIIGGVIGGLLLLALITAALYKAGFFKSQYKQLLQEAQGDAGGAPNMTQ
ncbi:integrin alpha-X-like [Pimephales promelas]|uniref:integrin alpha-X-like n=1 Tax=Pimephales promelas TaxID=90988 RepID=UPI001955BB71|nr:integrin alpha-X-like [Pimephales promelas]KAG1933410.1 integrin alpha-M-like [Pimephales promelas]